MTEDRPLRLATFLAPCIRPAYQAVAEYVAERLGRPVHLVEGASFAALAAGTVDAAFL